MIIIFYDANEEEIYICSKRQATKIIPLNDPDILSHIPNEDILYVSNGHIVSKSQFGEWLAGKFDLSDRIAPSVAESASNRVSHIDDTNSGKLYVHPTRNGAIFLPDIYTSKYPQGVSLVGKHCYIPIDDLGGMEALEESTHYKVLLAQGKIEVVTHDYVKKNATKVQKLSAKDQALEAITIPNDRRGSAERVAASGGLVGIDPISSSDPIPVFVEGDFHG